MKKTKLFAMMTVLLAMGLSACGGGKGSSTEPSKESSNPPASQSSQGGDQSQQSQQSQSSGQSQQSQSSGQSQQSQSSDSSTPATDATMAVTALDVIKESEKVYLKISGTISGFANADAMKMAFGLLDAIPAEGTEAQWLIGAEEPAAADYKLVPTVNATAGTFELKVDVSIITTVTPGVYTIYVGPQGAYAAVGATGVTMGTNKEVQSGFRWYIRGDKGALAMDELPPLELTESFVKVEGEGENAAIYHYIGGALNTTKLPEADFLAKHPYVQYEACVNWKTNVLGNAEKTDLVTTVVENGKAYIKTNITSLPDETYNIKFNLAEDKDADIKMDAVIDNRDESDWVHFNGHAYAVFADSSKTEKVDIYGNCGIYIYHDHTWERGEQLASSELYQLTCPTASHVGYELDLNTTNTPNLPNDKKVSGGKEATFNITGITEGEYAVYLKAHVSNGNHKADSKVGLSYGDQLDDNGNQAGGNAVPGRYSMQAGNNGDVEYTITGEKNFNKIGLDDYTTFKWTNCAVVKSLMIKGDAGTLKLTHTGAGYSLYIESVRLVRVGDYVKPYTAITLTENKMKIEAEDYHIRANNQSGTVTDDEAASGGKFVKELSYSSGSSGNPDTIGQLDYYVKASEALSLKVSVHAKSNKTEAAVALEVWVDGVQAGELSFADAYADVATDAVSFAAGRHIISLKGVNGVKTDIDYIELVKPAA